MQLHLNSYRDTVVKSRAVKQRNALDLFEQQVNQEQKQKLQQELHIALIICLLLDMIV